MFSHRLLPDDDDAKIDGSRAAARANNFRGGRISHLKMDRNDKGIMKLLTSKQAAERRADGKADGEGVARLGYEQNNQTGGR